MLISISSIFIHNMILFLQWTHKVNFRIGRTGRRDRSGTAYTFFTEKNQKSASQLVQILQEAKQVCKYVFIYLLAIWLNPFVPSIYFDDYVLGDVVCLYCVKYPKIIFQYIGENISFCSCRLVIE